MKPDICSSVICRTPVFSHQSKIENVWEELKSYIEESSPAFFDIIRDCEREDLNNLDPKTRFTLWKYFNRARFRATPYGQFVAFSIVPVAKEELPNEVTVIQKMIAHRFPDWSEKENVNLDPAWLLKNANFLRANTSAYICGNDLRYVNFIDGTFELSEVAAHELAMNTLRFCHDKQTLGDVHHFISSNALLTKRATDYFIQQLIDLQLLFTDFHPNITGNEYFKRIGSTISAKREDYVISERHIARGQLNEKNLQVLTELTVFLSKHIQLNKNPAMSEFRNRFLSRFENKEVPLLTALDPETGVNYMAFEQDTDQDNLVEELKKQADRPRDAAISSVSALQRYIIDQMLQHRPVQLANFKGTGLASPTPIANTITALLSFADELIITEHFGGSTANALLGRFTLASDEVLDMAKEFVKIEEQANPGILFFDIAYQAEKHVDNVNRRKSVYDYELPILTWTESANVIDLDDIMLSVSGEELILRSVKYGKRIIPRLASAYNYTRSDLTIFRFLSDLQQQNLQASLSVGIDQVLPGLLHYPRIQYKNVVLSAARWRVPEELCNTKEMPLAALRTWLSGLDLEKPFKCGVADQTLCFNPSIEEDMLAFLTYCKRKTGLYIEEAFLPVHTVVNDEHNKPYLSEFMVNLQHQQQLYQPVPAINVNPQQQIELRQNKQQQNKQQQPVKAMFMPGGEWVYFEIYCHTTRSNTILSDSIGKLLDTWKKDIKRWFFIRYTDPSNHIRLRLQLKPHTNGYQLMHFLSETLKPYMVSGIITDLQIKTYRPELERYGAARMSVVEKCFNIDSALVLCLLKNNFPVNQLYALSLTLIETVMDGTQLSITEQLSVAERSADSFTAEMKVGAEGFKKINQSFKEFTNYGDITFLTKPQNTRLYKTIMAFQEALATCVHEEKPKLLKDLFHMHVNRLFPTDQRMHEMIIYHFLVKVLKSRIGRQKNMNPPKTYK